MRDAVHAMRRRYRPSTTIHRHPAIHLPMLQTPHAALSLSSSFLRLPPPPDASYFDARRCRRYRRRRRERFTPDAHILPCYAHMPRA